MIHNADKCKCKAQNQNASSKVTFALRNRSRCTETRRAQQLTSRHTAWPACPGTCRTIAMRTSCSLSKRSGFATDVARCRAMPTPRSDDIDSAGTADT
eukprot:6213164-Pleurochrysis_carterae.AAC.1